MSPEESLEDKLVSIKRVKQGQTSGACGDIDPSIEFFEHKETKEIYICDNPGIEEYDKFEKYEGNLNKQQLLTKINDLSPYDWQKADEILHPYHASDADAP